MLKINYNTLKDAELIKACDDRGFVAPMNEDGRVIRTEAIRMLKTRDDTEAKNDVSERVWVVFHNSGSPSAGPYVFASVNEKNFQAPYEKEVCIPKYFLTECIDRAFTIKRSYSIQADGSTASVVTKVPTYPYTVIRPASAEDFA